MEELKIIGLKVDGIRKLEAVEMEFAEKGLTVIKGENRQGKTSLLDTIEWMIKGQKSINKQIVNNDKDQATGELALNKYVIKRATGRSNRLEVRNSETNELVKGEVQNFLNTFVNELTFNPRPFLDKTPYQMLQFALELFSDKLDAKSEEILGISFQNIDSKVGNLLNDRLFCGREIKRFGEIQLPEKVEKVDTAKLSEERKQIEDHNNKLLEKYEKAKQKELEGKESFNKEQREKEKELNDEKGRVDDLINIDKKNIDENIKNTEEEIEELKKKLAEQKIKRDKITDEIKFTEELISKLPQPEPELLLTSDIKRPELQSLTEIDLKISEAGEVNEKAAEYQRALQKQSDKFDKESEYKEYDDQINDLRQKKLEVLRTIDTGVDGLEIREDGLYYHDNYSENWSDAEGLIISSELCIAQKPDLSAVFIDDGESLDKESTKQLEKWAIENNIQAIVTKVVEELPDKLESGVFYITEGKIKKGK